MWRQYSLNCLLPSLSLSQQSDVIHVDIDGGHIFVPDTINLASLPEPFLSRTRHELNMVSMCYGLISKNDFHSQDSTLNFYNCIKNNHNFDLNDVKVIDRCSLLSKRFFLEAWHSIREPNAINEHIHIPDIYKTLGNPKWCFCAFLKALICFHKPFLCWRSL